MTETKEDHIVVKSINGMVYEVYKYHITPSPHHTDMDLYKFLRLRKQIKKKWGNNENLRHTGRVAY